jgi:hypothetical protein
MRHGKKIKMRGKFCKKLIGIPRCAANVFAARELGRYNGRVEVMGLVVKYRYRFMCVGMEDPVKLWYEWQKISKGLKFRKRNFIVWG